jgi:DNA-binding NarL/FixJ family response regulator
VETLRILIVEDEVIIAEALQEMLFQLGYANIQRCKTQEHAESVIHEGEIGLAILDINLAGNHEGIILGHLCKKKNIPFFFLSSYSDRKTLFEATQAKPGNYVIKPFSPEEILVAIELTLMHSQKKDKTKLQKATEVYGLSDREAEILDHIVARLSNQEIGEKLFLSLNTVKYHLRHIYAKMGASTKLEVISRIEYILIQND